MRNATIAKGEMECARIAKEMLDSKFPGWDRVRHRGSGARATLARFQGSEKHFSTSKEAYLWLVERFIAEKPDLFDHVNWETTYVSKGRKRAYFSRDITALFQGSPHLADDRNNYAPLTNGWFANTNLSNAQKFEVLCRFSGVTKLRQDDDWDWEVDDASEGLRDKLERKALGARLLKEFVSKARKDTPGTT